MAGRTRFWGWGAAIAVIAAAAITLDLLPSDAEDYREVAVQSANDTMGQVRAVQVLVESDVAGHAFGTYADTVVWQARDKLSTAVSDLVSEEVPDATAARVQTELNRLLATAQTAIGDAEVALDGDDHAAKQRAVRALDGVGDKLNAFSEANR